MVGTRSRGKMAKVYGKQVLGFWSNGTDRGLREVNGEQWWTSREGLALIELRWVDGSGGKRPSCATKSKVATGLGDRAERSPEWMATGPPRLCFTALPWRNKNSNALIGWDFEYFNKLNPMMLWFYMSMQTEILGNSEAMRKILIFRCNECRCGAPRKVLVSK